MQAQQLIEERETQKQLAELPLIQMPMVQSQTISVRKKPSFLIESIFLILFFI